MRVSAYSVLGGVLLVSCALASCATNPATGKPILSLVSNDQEVQMGEEAMQEVKQTIGLVDDEQLQRYITGIGEKMAATSERPNLPWYFAVVDDASVNAFALPGGKIFITRGLCAHVDNEAQLATVIGHEIGHVTARHSVQRMSQQELISLGLGVGMVLSDKAQQFEPLASAGLSVLFLKFSRNDEYQADKLGVRYASRVNYDVRQMPEMFRMLERVSEQNDQGRLPEWLSTHPEPENRIEHVEELIDKAASKETEPRTLREHYLRHLEGLVYGADPREGFARDGRFYHPGLGFSIAIPDGWKTQNTREALIMGTGKQDALIQLTVGPAQDPARALQALASEQGVELGEGNKDVVPDMRSVSADVKLTTKEEGTLVGLVTYVNFGDHTYQLLGLAKPDVAADYMPEFAEVHASFREVKDRAVLKVEPARVALVKAPDDTTLESLYARDPASISLSRLALLNQLEPSSKVEEGQLLKWVRGGAAKEEAEHAQR